MSTTQATTETNNEGDLINLYDASPVLPPQPSTSFEEVPSDQDQHENLIDTELPILEEKLQKTYNNNNIKSHSRKPSIDVEDILITIDDDTPKNNFTTNKSTLQRCSSVDCLDGPVINDDNFYITKSLSCDNLEALQVLNNLDNVLNASLLESNKILNLTESSVDSSSSINDLVVVVTDEQAQKYVEDCLQDLDNYLKDFDSDLSSSSSSAHELSSSINSKTSFDEDDYDDDDDDALRCKLRQIEENYNKFLASGFVNRGYINTENGYGLVDHHESENKRRPLSACDERAQASDLNRNQRGRATVAVVRRERPALLQRSVHCQSMRNNTTNKRKNNNNNNNINPNKPHLVDNTKQNNTKCKLSGEIPETRDRISYQQRPGVTNNNNSNSSTTNSNSSSDDSDDFDESIDWSWVHEVAFSDVTLEKDRNCDAAVKETDRERLAHAANDCCTGTVVVEPLHYNNKVHLQHKTPLTEPDLYTTTTNNKNIHGANQSQTPSSSVVVDIMSSGSGKNCGDQSSEDRNNVASSWLRSSMRRLRHFRLPSDAIQGGGTNQFAETNSELEAGRILETLQSQAAQTPETPIQTINHNLRPLSAPSRLIPTIRTTNSVNNVSRAAHTNTTTTTNNNNPLRVLQRSRSRSRESRESAVSHEPGGGRARSSSESSRSRRPRSLSSSESSLASSVDTSPSFTPAPTPTHNNTQESSTPNSTTNTANNNNRRPCERSRTSDMPEAESPLGHWPHSFSSMMACLGCTLGLFNISRFAILTVHFGANFILQFFFLTLVFGLPLFTLQLCLGQQLGAGVIDMWRISPLFQGVGVSLLLAQTLMGLYSIIGVSWMFVYFRDSFITKVDKYRWAEPFVFYRDEIQVPVNGSYKLSETIPDYLSGVVLQRHHLPSGNSYGTIKFQLAFNLAVVWMIVFVSLSKGLRSYGKVIYVFTLLPVFSTFVLCAKILGMMPSPELFNVIFPETSWSEFFLNSKSWLAAAQETFMTWGLLGAAIMQIASHNKHKHLLQRDSSLIAVITLVVLLLVAFLANTCVQILKFYGYSYLPDSFERMSSYTFLRSHRDPLPPSLASTPVRYMTHNSFIVGEKVVRPGVDYTSESGFQVLRLATELVPATFAVMGSDLVSPFWAVLFYFILILFGIAQQLAIWHCVITGIMAIKAKVLKSWETTITFFSCACGFLLGLPMATELGIYVVYFMDYTVGGIWWLILVILLQIMAVFMVRGRPYSGDTVVTALFTPNNHPCILGWAPAMLSFTWNVILPVALMVLCITTFKNGNFREIFIWHHAPVAEYWPLWARQIGSMLQLIPILCVPLVAVIQSYRYLSNGELHHDILDRIQLLYRPPIGEHMEDITVPPTQSNPNNSGNNNSTTQITEDPPPKYTPPPSYTTATGARIAKFLRQSIRRSVRRLANVLGESSNTRQRNPLPNNSLQPPPPDYNAVLVEMNQTSSMRNNNNADVVSISVTDSSVVPHNTPTNNNNKNLRISTLERLRNVEASSSASLTAAEVASILRSSFRRSTLRTGHNIRNTNFNDNSISSMSAENLIESAAPIGETSLVLDQSLISSSAEK